MVGDGSIEAVVTDDSQFMRRMISDILEDGGISVVAEAKDGQVALEAVEKHRPDVVTMDLQMPVMDGVEATERIMSEFPTPVLVLSAHASEHAEVTFQALDNGAVDFFAKPGGEVSTEMQRHRDRLVKKVKAVAGASVSSVETTRPAVNTAPESSVQSHSSNTTLIIGSSTGGPRVVEDLLGSLPRDLGLRILIVQHMPSGFTERFADRLDTNSEYTVWEADDGDRLGAGDAVVAQGDYHMKIANYTAGTLRLNLTKEPPIHGVRPSVDATLSSVASTIDGPLIGVILTGMGRDGADGVTDLAVAGGRIIAQDKETSAVFGMPKQAIQTGHVDSVLPMTEIPDQIQKFAQLEASA